MLVVMDDIGDKHAVDIKFLYLGIQATNAHQIVHGLQRVNNVKIIVELVFFKVPLRNFISKVEESFKFNEEKTMVSNHVILLENLVNHELKTDSIIDSSESETIKTNFIKVFHYFFFLVVAMVVIQAICMDEEL